MILASLALVAGFANATPFGSSWERFKKYVEPSSEAVVVDAVLPSGPGEAIVLNPSVEMSSGVQPRAEEAASEGCAISEPAPGTACYFPTVSHAEFEWSKAGLSLVIVALGLVSSWIVSVQLYTRRNRFLVGLTKRNVVLRGIYGFLWNKYYLDALYEKVIVRAIAHPIARGAYWFNQHVIDAIVNGAARVARSVAGWVYKNVDQRVVDGAVNASGATARGTGGLLRPVQSGKINQYGALLFASAAIGALILVIINS